MVCVLAAIERGFRNYREIEVIKMVNVTVKLTVIPKSIICRCFGAVVYEIPAKKLAVLNSQCDKEPLPW